MVNKILLGLFLSLGLSQLQAAEGETRKRRHSSQDEEVNDNLGKRKPLEKEKCLICLAEEDEAGTFATNDELSGLLTCNADKHSNMHLACLNQALAADKRCPICRAPVNPTAAAVTADSEDDDGNTPQDRNTWLHTAVRWIDLDEVRALLASGVDVNHQDTDGYTPLHYAVRSQDLDIVRVLLAAGANVNTQNNDGDTPLHLANGDDNLDIVRALLAAGANVDIKNNAGFTTLSRVVFFDNNIEYIQILIAAGANVNTQNNFGYTPLHNAATVEVVQALLAVPGIDVNARTNIGSTPLHSAAGRSRGLAIVQDNVAAYSHVEVVQALLATGADVNARDITGSTPLHNAAERFDTLGIVQALLAAPGINVNIRDNQGQRPIDLARTNGIRDLLRPRTASSRWALGCTIQ